MSSGTQRLAVLGGVAVVLFLWVGRVYFGGDSIEDAASGLSADKTDDRVKAIGQLERVGNGAAAGRIAQHVGDRDARVAARAVYALGRMGSKQNIPAVRQALKDDRSAVREAAVFSLTTLSDRESPPSEVLRAMKEDEAPSVRAAAASAVGEHHVFKAMPDLMHALRDTSPAVRARAIASVNRMLGRRYRFNVNDPPAKREAVIKEIESIFPHFEQVHRMYVKRQTTDKNQR